LPALRCTLTLLSAGRRTLSANYPDNANFLPSSRTATHAVLADVLLKNDFE